MNELLEVMDHKNKSSGHKSPARVSLPFFINLDVEVEKEWKKLFFLVFIGFSILVEGMRENGYEGMPPVQEMIASYLSVGETSSLKAPSLPS